MHTSAKFRHIFEYNLEAINVDNSMATQLQDVNIHKYVPAWQTHTHAHVGLRYIHLCTHIHTNIYLKATYVSMRLSELKWRLQHSYLCQTQGQTHKFINKSLLIALFWAKSECGTRLQFLVRQDSKHIHTHTYAIHMYECIRTRATANIVE